MEYFATCNGIPTHIFDSGKGEKTLFFLHGYLETLYIWNDFFEKISPKYRVVAIDLPGHGLTGSHPTENSMEFCANTVIGVLDKCKIEKAVIIGHSMGGYIGQQAMKQYPERIEKLVHFNSNPYSDDPSKKGERLKEIEFIEGGKLSMLASIAIPNMYAKDNLRRMDNKIEETVENCETHDPLGICASVRGLMTREDNVEYLNKSGKDILFIFGDKDLYLSPEKGNKILEEIPSAKGVFIPNTGHNSFIEEPALTLKALMEFLV